CGALPSYRPPGRNHRASCRRQAAGDPALLSALSRKGRAAGRRGGGRLQRRGNPAYDTIEVVMTPRTLGLTDQLHEYLLRAGVREPEELRRVREETSRLPGVDMLLAPEQGQFMALLARLLGVACYLEIGTHTGYSALAMGPGGKVVSCEIDAASAAIAE